MPHDHGVAEEDPDVARVQLAHGPVMIITILM